LSFGEFVRNERRYFTGIVRDVSERKQAADAQKSKRTFSNWKECGGGLPRTSTMTSIEPDADLIEQGRKIAKTATTRRLVDDCQRLRELIDAMSDIVGPSIQRSPSDLKQRMRRFAADVLTARNIELDFRALNEETDILGANITL
jgi:hypothetical protein